LASRSSATFGGYTVKLVDQSKIQALINGHITRNQELKKLIASKGLD